MSRVLKSHQLKPSGSWRPDVQRQLPVEPAVAGALPTESLPAAEKLETAHLLEQAKKEAATILAAAEEEAAKRQEVGFEAGFRTGYAAGEEEGRATWQVKLGEVVALKKRLMTKDDQLLQEAEQEVKQIVIAIVERVINHVLREDAPALQGAVEQVLQVAKGCREALLLVSDEDFPAVWERRSEWKQMLPGVREFAVQVGPELSKGDLVLETNQGIIDARVDTVVEQVTTLLKNKATS